MTTRETSLLKRFGQWVMMIGHTEGSSTVIVLSKEWVVTKNLPRRYFPLKTTRITSVRVIASAAPAQDYKNWLVNDSKREHQIGRPQSPNRGKSIKRTHRGHPVSMMRRTCALWTSCLWPFSRYSFAKEISVLIDWSSSELLFLTVLTLEQPLCDVPPMICCL